MKKTMLAFSTMLIAFTVPAQKPLITKYLQNDVSLVAGFNPVRIAKKVPGDVFRQSKLYEQIIGKDADLKRLFENPEITGIDFESNLWVVAGKNADKPGNAQVSIYGVLKNESAFSNLISKVAKGEDGIKRYGTDRQMVSEGGPALAWNNEVFVIALPEKKKPQVYDEEVYDTAASENDFMVDTLPAVDYEKQWQEQKEAEKRAMRDRCFTLLTPKNNSTLLMNKALMYALASEADIRLWSDGSPNAALQKINPVGKELSILSKLAGQNKTSLINFENGRITAKTKSFLDDDIAAMYEKYPQATAPVDMIKRLPPGNVLATFVTSFNTGLAKDMMNESGLTKMMDSIRKIVPFIDKITEAFKGNMMLAVMKSNNPANQKGKLKGIELIVAIPVANRAKLEEVQKEVKELMAKAGSSGKKGKMLSELNPVVRFNEQYFVIALTENAADAFLNNPGTGEIPSWLQEYQQYPMIANISFRPILNVVFADEGKEGPKTEQMKKIIGNFEGITFSGGYYADKSLNGTAEFSFSNKQENVILQLFNFANSMMKDKKTSSEE